MKNIEKYIENLRFICEEVEKIENYDKLIKNPELQWVCHHRKEIENNYTVYNHNDLIRLDLYYHRPPEELIFLTFSEHIKLHHNTVNFKKNMSNKIKERYDDEYRLKISKAKKGQIPWNKGKNYTQKKKTLI